MLLPYIQCIIGLGPGPGNGCDQGVSTHFMLYIADSMWGGYAAFAIAGVEQTNVVFPQTCQLGQVVCPSCHVACGQRDRSMSPVERGALLALEDVVYPDGF
jgi:hypothetical protein